MRKKYVETALTDVRRCHCGSDCYHPPMVASGRAEVAGPVPARLGPLIGRSTEQHQLRRLIVAGVPLITATGIAGVGKTRLVRESLSDVPAVWFHAGADPTSLLPALAEWAESRLSQPNRGDEATVVVLDSIDDPEIGASLVAIADRLADVQVVVTSRGRLNVAGEVLFRVPPLPYPTHDDTIDTTNPSQWASIECFLQAAIRVAPGFAFNEHTARGVAELAQMSGGVPLALQLAAQWLRVCDLDELVARARATMEPFAGRTSGLAGDQENLRSSIDGLISGLASDELKVLGAAAHIGTPTLAGLGHALGAPVPLQMLGDLIDRNLLDVSSGDGRIMRVHPLVRRVVTEQVDGRCVRRAYLEWLCTEASESVPTLTTARSREGFDRLDERNPDFSAALELLEAEPSRVAALVTTLTPYWSLTRGYRMELFWAQRVLSIVGDTHERAAHLHAICCSAGVALSAEDATRHGRRALELARRTNDGEALAEAHRALMELAYRAGGLSLDDELGEVIARCRPGMRADLLTLEALIMLQRGDAPSARALATDALGSTHADGDIFRAGIALSTLCEIETGCGSHDAAFAHAQQALGLAGQLDARCGLEPNARSSLISCLTERGDLAQALVEAAATVRGFENLRASLGLAQAVRDLAHLQSVNGAAAAARGSFIRSIELWQALNQPFLTLVTLLTVAVSPPPVRPDDALCRAILEAVEASSPGFTHQQRGYWGRQIERLHNDLGDRSDEQPRATVEVPDQLAARTLTHLGHARTNGPETQVGLTRRQSDVLRQLADGSTDQEIAAALHLSVRTVNSHVSTILRKLNVERRRQAAAWYRANATPRDGR